MFREVVHQLLRHIHAVALREEAQGHTLVIIDHHAQCRVAFVVLDELREVADEAIGNLLHGQLQVQLLDHLLKGNFFLNYMNIRFFYSLGF